MELQQQFSRISDLIAKAKERAYHAVNKELVRLYWHIGEYVNQQVVTKAWGKSVVTELAAFIQKTEPNIRGFSPQNIWRMKQFYETYKDNEKLSTLSRELLHLPEQHLEKDLRKAITQNITKPNYPTKHCYKTSGKKLLTL